MKTYSLFTRICLRWIGPLVTIPVIFMSDATDLQKGLIILGSFIVDYLSELRGRDSQLRQLKDLGVIRPEFSDSDDSDHLITGSGKIA